MLKINSLVLHNFTCVSHAEFDFSEDKTVLLIGKNGQGKSSILSAIALCLTGETRGTAFKDLIKLGKDDGYVKLNALINNKPLDIEVTLHIKNGRVRTIKYEDKIYINTDANDLIKSLEIDFYADIMLSIQGKSEDITNQGPAERKYYLQKLLNFEFAEKLKPYKEKVENLNSTIDEIEKSININEKLITQKNKEIQEEIDFFFTDDDIIKLQSEIGGLTSEIDNFSGNISKKNNLLNELSKLKSQCSDLNNEKSQNFIKIKNLNEKKAEYDNLENEISASSTKITQEENLLKKYIIENEDFKKILDSHKEVLKEAQDEKNKLDYELKDIKKKKDLLSKGKCPTCGNEFTSTEIEDVEKSYIEISEKCERAAANIKSLEINVAAASVDYNNSTFSINNANSSINSEKRQKSYLESKLKSKPDFSNIESLENRNKEIDSMVNLKNSEIATKENEIKEIDKALSDYSRINKELKEKQDLLNSYNNSILKNSLILQNNKKIRESIILMEEQIKNNMSSLESYRKSLLSYTDCIDIFEKAFPNYLIVKTCSKLERAINNFIQTIFPEMEVRLFQNKQGVEFFYTPEKSKVKKWIKENLLNAKNASGFEKAALSMSFKVALLKAYDIPFAFLDEVDSAADDENSESMFKAIISNNIFEQIFIISHKSSVRDSIVTIAPKAKVYYVSNGNFTTEEQ